MKLTVHLRARGCVSFLRMACGLLDWCLAVPQFNPMELIIMKPSCMTKRVMAGLLAVTLAAVSITPPADARGRGRGHGDRRGGNEWRQSHGRPSGHGYRSGYRRSSSLGPALGGFIGGMAVGSMIGRRSGSYYYQDPYCDRRYSSLGSFQSGTMNCDHPMVTRVISAQSGGCMNTYGYDDGGWVPYGADWDPAGSGSAYGRSGCC